MSEINEQKRPLRDSLLERIESEKVCPRSRLFFQGRELIVWTLWLLSVVVGAFAVAVVVFVLIHGQYALYEASHENFIFFMVETLPYLWIVVFSTMVFVAAYNIRRTRRGYKYPLWVVMTSSVLLSVTGGLTLQLFSLGYEIDELFGRYMFLYTSQYKFEEQLWQDPDDGRLLGVQVYTTLSPTTTVIFKDLDGHTWTMNVGELPILDREALSSEQTVRLIGKMVDERTMQFHACGVFPWVHGRDLSTQEMDEQRRQFIERVSEHAQKAESRYSSGAQNLDQAFVSPVESVCATIAPVHRVPGL